MWRWVGKGAKWLVTSGALTQVISRLVNRKPKPTAVGERCTALESATGLQCLRPAGHAPMHEVVTEDADLQWWP